MGGPLLPERAFQRQVVELAHLYGFREYHALNSRGSAHGWPDLVLCRPPDVLFVELKAEQTAVTADQIEWLAALAACGLETHLWRPSQFDEIHERLARGRRRIPAPDGEVE